MNKERKHLGVTSALTSALFLGLTPVIGKNAIIIGFSPLSVVALRTAMAALLLLFVLLIIKRKFLYIYPAGLLACSLAGLINGLGSVFYYQSLKYLDASIGSLLYSLYPVFLTIWLLLDRQPITIVTISRVIIAAVGVLLLTVASTKTISWVGIIFMLIAAALYALHLPINQHVLYDLPAPTVTVYTLFAMSLVVIPAFLLFDHQLPSPHTHWWPIVALTLVTFLSRLTLFLGIKHLGGLQTALLGLSELFISILVSNIWLNERLNAIQWIGAGLLGISLFLVTGEKLSTGRYQRPIGWLSWLRSPGITRGIPWNPHD